MHYNVTIRVVLFTSQLKSLSMILYFEKFLYLKLELNINQWIIHFAIYTLFKRNVKSGYYKNIYKNKNKTFAILGILQES